MNERLEPWKCPLLERKEHLTIDVWAFILVFGEFLKAFLPSRLLDISLGPTILAWIPVFFLFGFSKR